MKIFNLPDLGEGLPDAEIVEWLVREGETVRVDQPLISMETAKAVVEVPSPYTGTLVKLFGGAGDVIATGAPLAGFELAEGVSQRPDVEPTHHHAPAAKPAAEARADTGTVVGAMESSDRVVAERASQVGGIRVLPAVRALARKLGVDLAAVRPSGPEGLVTLADVRGHAERPVAPAAAAPAPPAKTAPTAALESAADGGHLSPSQRRAAAAGQVLPTASPSPSSNWHRGFPHAERTEQLRGVRRNMARVMAEAHAAVVLTTLVDDADIQDWRRGEDISARLVRSIVAAARAEPGLNAWFDGARGERHVHGAVHLGIAVDSPEGLFVPVLRQAENLGSAEIRAAINRLRSAVADRSVAPAELSGATISLSNFGVFAGRYATPIVVPPMVAIIGAGRLRHDAVPVLGGFAARRMLPLSLSFDHRACTGGEAARFLRAMIEDLQQAD